METNRNTESLVNSDSKNSNLMLLEGKSNTIHPLYANPNFENFFQQLQSQMNLYSVTTPMQNNNNSCDKKPEFFSEEKCQTLQVTEEHQQSSTISQNKDCDIILTDVDSFSQTQVTPLSSTTCESSGSFSTTATTPQSPLPQQTSSMLEDDNEVAEDAPADALQLHSENVKIIPTCIRAQQIPLEQLIYEKFTSSFLQQIQSIKIPASIQDLYGLSTVSIPLSKGVTLSLPLEQEFRSLNYCVTFWDPKSLQLLAFQDNFVHYVGRPKQDLLQGSFTLIDTTTPNARVMAVQVMEKYMQLGAKTLELDAGFYRECDGRIVFLYHKMYFENEYIRMEHFLGKGSHDGFILNGKIYPKFIETPTMLQGSAQEAFLAAKGTRLLQAIN